MMKKQMMIYTLVGVLLIVSLQVYASEIIEVTQLAQDVFIEGISESAELYIGEERTIRGYVDEQATEKAIIWQITGNNGIIEFNEEGNEARILAKAPGTVWIMARANDGSDRTREYTLTVKLPQQLDPPVEEAEPLVEENKVIVEGGSGQTPEDAMIITLPENLSAAQKTTLMRNYLADLKAHYQVRVRGKREHQAFTAYELKAKEGKNDFYIEIRVDKEDQDAYIPIIEMLDDLEKEVVQGGESQGAERPIDQVDRLVEESSKIKEVQKESNSVNSYDQESNEIKESQNRSDQEEQEGQQEQQEQQVKDNVQPVDSQEGEEQPKEKRSLYVSLMVLCLTIGITVMLKKSTL